MARRTKRSIPTHAGKPVQPVGRDGAPRVYPHACGETDGARHWVTRLLGLSPRMRGNPCLRLWSLCQAGSIPTHAGKPNGTAGKDHGDKVYPHACGETYGEIETIVTRCGLSPRMRGNLVVVAGPDSHFGSIPTHAGKPLSGSLIAAAVMVYPHACGETILPAPTRGIRLGLSPRMRGNHNFGLGSVAGFGSIPTHAGKPRSSISYIIRTGVYPHACGETRLSLLRPEHEKGLSPRMRGNPLTRARPAVALGSIPTHAGKPVRHHPCSYLVGVYPHACGETVPFRIDGFRCAGLSPRMRGNPKAEDYILHVERSIPTHAGKPFGAPSTNIAFKVYPHACGETSAN